MSVAENTVCVTFGARLCSAALGGPASSRTTLPAGVSTRARPDRCKTCARNSTKSHPFPQKWFPGPTVCCLRLLQNVRSCYDSYDLAHTEVMHFTVGDAFLVTPLMEYLFFSRPHVSCESQHLIDTHLVSSSRGALVLRFLLVGGHGPPKVRLTVRLSRCSAFRNVIVAQAAVRI